MLVQKVSNEMILSSLKKREISINEDDFKLTLEKLVAAWRYYTSIVATNTLMLHKGDSKIFYNICDDTVLVSEPQEISTAEILPAAVNMEDPLANILAGKNSDNNAKNDNFSVEVIVKELNSFWEFQSKIESKLDKVVEVVTGKSKNDNGNVNDNAD